MKQSLQLRMGQSLTMTPQLQQAIRLLQLSTLDLQNEIQEALDSNPMLEVGDDTTDKNGNTIEEPSVFENSQSNNASLNSDTTNNSESSSNDSQSLSASDHSDSPSESGSQTDDIGSVYEWSQELSLIHL